MTNIMQSNNMVTKSDQKKLSKSELIKLLLKHNERIEKKRKASLKAYSCSQKKRKTDGSRL